MIARPLTSSSQPRFGASSIPTLGILLTISAISLWGCAHAPSTDGGEETSAPLTIPHEMYTLDNGLRVILSEDHATPYAHVEVWYQVGSKDERKGRSGFAHLFEHLMFQGSEHADGEYFAPLQAYGATINGTTNRDRTNYFEKVPSHVLERALWMEADRMGHLLPALTQEKLDNQREVVRNERRQNYEMRPYAIAQKAISEAIYPEGHPYRHLTIGSHEDLQAATLDDVKGFFREWYGPNNATLVVVGDFDPAQTKAWIEKFFGGIPAIEAGSEVREFTLKPQPATTVVLEDNVSLPRVYLSWPSAPFFKAGDAALDVLSSVLSAGPQSRLYKALVLEQKLASDVYAGQWSSLLGSTYNIIATAAPGIDPQTLSEALQTEIARVKTEEPITGDEFDRALNGWKKSYYGRLETVNGRASTLQLYNYYLGTPDGLATDLARYTSLSAQALLDEANATLDPAFCQTIIITPAKKEVAQ